MIVMCWNSRGRSPCNFFYLRYKFLINNIFKMNSNYFVHWHICIRRANPPQLRTIFLRVFYWKGWHSPERFVLFPPSPSLGESWIHPWGRVQFILQSMKEFINVSMTTLSFYVILICVWAHVLASKCAFACFCGVVITMESFKLQNYVNV